MPSRFLAAVVLAVVLPQLAFARPAVIRVFEAAARAEPSPEAAVLLVLPEKSEVSVSEEANGGWRRVRLPDGSVGWVEESALAFPEAAAARSTAVPPALAAAAPAPDLRARIYVKDLSHLAELVRSDAAVSLRAEALASRRRASIGIWIAGAIATLALVGASLSNANPAPGDPDFDAALDRDGKLIGGGVAVAFGTTLLGLAIHPRRGELLDVVNGWNTSHPERQFEIERGEVGQR